MDRPLTEIQETVFKKSYRGKIHLYLHCRYLNDVDDPMTYDSSSFPENHYEVCSTCEEYYENWDESLRPEPEIECTRCGKKDQQLAAFSDKLCESCWREVQLNR